MTTYHPRLNNHGQRHLIATPSTPTALDCWLAPGRAATVLPDGAMPQALGGIAFTPWRDVPASDAAWREVAGQCALDEPAFNVPAGLRAAAGVVIEEADGRIWLVAPTNAFGGYTATFPKGTVEQGLSLQASAIREAWEEAGLQVRITGYLADCRRSVSYTRYYLAERVGGTPAAMGWESQAVHLVPRAALPQYLNNANDKPIIDALQARMR